MIKTDEAQADLGRSHIRTIYPIRLIRPILSPTGRALVAPRKWPLDLAPAQTPAKGQAFWTPSPALGGTCIALQTLYSFKIDSAQNARTLVVCDARGRDYASRVPARIL
jgi:hypothetical protein